MNKIDVLKVALDLASVLSDGGEEINEVLESDTTKRLVDDVERLIADLKGAKK